MINKIARISFALLIAAACTTGSAQVGESFIEGVHVRVELNKTEIVTGEPIFLNITVRNVSAGTDLNTLGARFFFSEGNSIDVRVQPPNELAYRYEALDDPALYGTSQLDVAKRQPMKNSLLMLADKKQKSGYLFPTPGTYQVSVVFSHSILGDPVETQTVIRPVDIVVTEPAGKAAEAWKLLNRPDVARTLQRPGNGTPETFRIIEQVARDYSDTVYAPLCTYANSLAALNSEKPDYNRVALQSIAFATKYPEHPRFETALGNIIFAYDKLKKYELCIEWLYYMQVAAPQSLSLGERDPMALKFFHTPAREAASRRWWLYEKPWVIKSEEQRAQEQAAGL